MYPGAITSVAGGRPADFPYAIFDLYEHARVLSLALPGDVSCAVRFDALPPAAQAAVLTQRGLTTEGTEGIAPSTLIPLTTPLLCAEADARQAQAVSVGASAHAALQPSPPPSAAESKRALDLVLRYVDTSLRSVTGGGGGASSDTPLLPPPAVAVPLRVDTSAALVAADGGKAAADLGWTQANARVLLSSRAGEGAFLPPVAPAYDPRFEPLAVTRERERAGAAAVGPMPANFRALLVSPRVSDAFQATAATILLFFHLLPPFPFPRQASLLGVCVRDGGADHAYIYGIVCEASRSAEITFRHQRRMWRASLGCAGGAGAGAVAGAGAAGGAVAAAAAAEDDPDAPHGARELEDLSLPPHLQTDVDAAGVSGTTTTGPGFAAWDSQIDVAGRLVGSARPRSPPAPLFALQQLLETLRTLLGADKVEKIDALTGLPISAAADRAQEGMGADDHSDGDGVVERVAVGPPVKKKLGRPRTKARPELQPPKPIVAGSAADRARFEALISSAARLREGGLIAWRRYEAVLLSCARGEADPGWALPALPDTVVPAQVRFLPHCFRAKIK